MGGLCVRTKSLVSQLFSSASKAFVFIQEICEKLVLRVAGSVPGPGDTAVNTSLLPSWPCWVSIVRLSAPRPPLPQHSVGLVQEWTQGTQINPFNLSQIQASKARSISFEDLIIS